jgi:hypothetical protein
MSFPRSRSPDRYRRALSCVHKPLAEGHQSGSFRSRAEPATPCTAGSDSATFHHRETALPLHSFGGLSDYDCEHQSFGGGWRWPGPVGPGLLHLLAWPPPRSRLAVVSVIDDELPRGAWEFATPVGCAAIGFTKQILMIFERSSSVRTHFRPTLRQGHWPARSLSATNRLVHGSTGPATCSRVNT